MNVNYIPQALTEVYCQSLSQRKCPQRFGHIQAIRFVDLRCSRECVKWCHMWKLSRKRLDLATDAHWKWNNTQPNSQLRCLKLLSQHSFVFKDICGACFPSTAMYGCSLHQQKRGAQHMGCQQQKEWISPLWRDKKNTVEGVIEKCGWPFTIPCRISVVLKLHPKDGKGT